MCYLSSDYVLERMQPQSHWTICQWWKLLRTFESKLVFKEKKKPIYNLSRSNQMFSTDQITELTSLFANLFLSHHLIYVPWLIEIFFAIRFLSGLESNPNQAQSSFRIWIPKKMTVICTAIIHYIDIHLEMQYSCTLQNIRYKPVQSGRQWIRN